MLNLWVAGHLVIDVEHGFVLDSLFYRITGTAYIILCVLIRWLLCNIRPIFKCYVIVLGVCGYQCINVPVSWISCDTEAFWYVWTVAFRVCFSSGYTRLSMSRWQKLIVAFLLIVVWWPFVLYCVWQATTLGILWFSASSILILLMKHNNMFFKSLNLKRSNFQGLVQKQVWIMIKLTN